MRTYKIVFSGLLLAQLWQNRIWMLAEDTTDPEEVANQLDQGWVNHLLLLQHAGCDWLNINVTEFHEGPPNGFSKAISKHGTQSPEANAYSFTCGLIRFNTGLAGRKYRGRYYLPGFRQGATVAGRFQQSELDLWAQQLALISTNFIGPDTASGMRLIIRGEGANHHDTPVTNMQMTPIIRLQRRRNIGVGQ